MFQQLAKINGHPILDYGLRSKAVRHLEEACVSWEKQHFSMADLVALGDCSLLEQQKQSLSEALQSALATYFDTTKATSAIKKWPRYDTATGFVSEKTVQSVMDKMGIEEDLMTQQSSSLDFW